MIPQAHVECSQIWSSCTEVDLANQMPFLPGLSKQKPTNKDRSTDTACFAWPSLHASDSGFMAALVSAALQAASTSCVGLAKTNGVLQIRASEGL